MSILSELNSKYNIDTFEAESDFKDIENLMQFSQISIPEDYMNIIKEKTEIEINVYHEKYLRIWGASNCIEMNIAHKIQKYIPLSLAIADDEGENILIYATGSKGFGLYVVEFGDLDVEEMIYISESLTDLLVHGKGIDMLLGC